MNHYPHHIGDFNNATRHLTRVERSLYRDMIELYYDTEQPLNADTNKIARRILATSDDERESMLLVLEEFFVLRDDGWHNTRCDDEIAKYQGQIQQASRAGKASAAKRFNKTTTPGEQAFNERSTPVASALNQPEPEPEPEPYLEAKASLSPVSEKTHEVAARSKPAKQKADGFVLPEWINPDHWAAWRSHPKLKNATAEQKQIAVEKLAKWREAGDNFAGALENAAASGYQGLFLPDTRTGNSTGAGSTTQAETNYQRSMRERYEEATGSKRVTSLDVIDITSNTLEITA